MDGLDSQTNDQFIPKVGRGDGTGTSIVIVCLVLVDEVCKVDFAAEGGGAAVSLHQTGFEDTFGRGAASRL
jgi:hypothetical protein